MRYSPINVLTSVFECDSKAIQSVAVDIYVDVVVPQSSGNRLDQFRRNSSFRIAVDHLQMKIVCRVLCRPPPVRLFEKASGFEVIDVVIDRSLGQLKCLNNLLNRC